MLSPRAGPLDGLLSVSLDWGRLKDLLQSMEAKLEDKATKESMNAMVSQIMSRANEVAQVREELLQKVLAADQRVGEATTETAATRSRPGDDVEEMPARRCRRGDAGEEMTLDRFVK